MNCFVRPHEGKQDLQQSIPRKIRVASKKDIITGFIILQDQDSNDCRKLKSQIVKLCEDAQQGSRSVPFKVRIVCHELEAWYLGDMDAIEHVFPRFHAANYRGKKSFRQPDECNNPKQELKKNCRRLCPDSNGAGDCSPSGHRGQQVSQLQVFHFRASVNGELIMRYDRDGDYRYQRDSGYMGAVSEHGM